MKIMTQDNSPWGWTAVDADEYDGPGSPIGQGKTEEAAIADLHEVIQMHKDDVIWRAHEAEYEAEVMNGEHAPWYDRTPYGREPE